MNIFVSRYLKNKCILIVSKRCLLNKIIFAGNKMQKLTSMNGQLSDVTYRFNLIIHDALGISVWICTSVIHKNKLLPSQQIYNLSIENVTATVGRHIAAARCSTIGAFERRTYFRYRATSKKVPGCGLFHFGLFNFQRTLNVI